MNLRTLLVLGRVSNLPTVWSNLLTGWMLADIRPLLGFNAAYDPNATIWPILHLILGGSFLYIGGMYLNDYCDAAFDARYCPQRPIPSGQIPRTLVGLMSLLWFSAGFACLTWFGLATLACALLLIGAIVLYDFHHKDVAWAPLLMGFCRVLLYLLAACSVRECIYFSGSPRQAQGIEFEFESCWYATISYLHQDWWHIALDAVRLALPAAIMLGLYVAGITYFARGESRQQSPARWALILILMPVLAQCVLNFILNTQFPPMYSLKRPHLPMSSWLFWQSWWLPYAVLFLGWTMWLLIPLWRGTKRSVGRVVSGMLAGIVLVDMMALSGSPFGHPPEFLAVFFFLALLLQRFVPAT